MWLKWLPWKWAIRQAAHTHGFLDPINVLARLRRFAEPSEVAEPIELLRAGVAFHARGLINSRVIQHNLDWVWPYWIEQQFDPHSTSFLPRAFTITHVNLTHRNWTAVGLPDRPNTAIVDPRGLVTPLYDGWSLDAWIVGDDGDALVPSRSDCVQQNLIIDERLAVHTRTNAKDRCLETTAELIGVGDETRLQLHLRASAGPHSWLVCALRPYNPEGVSFIHDVRLHDDRRGWSVDGVRLDFSEPCERHHLSTYREGDVFTNLNQTDQHGQVVCDVGMATAGAMFQLSPGYAREVSISLTVPQPDEPQNTTPTWADVTSDVCTLKIGDVRMQLLYDAALRTLILHSPLDVYPGPYTYKRFWFRDAAFILHAMLCLGMSSRVERAMACFGRRQDRNGYFLSQEGEWDSNGQVLWLFERFHQLVGRDAQLPLSAMVSRGADWIIAKRLPNTLPGPQAGLLPAGFSAEHLGPNDYYYWDDYWGLAGLRSGARILSRLGHEDRAERCRRYAGDFSHAIESSLEHVANRLGQAVLPASPLRRLDAGAIGSLVASYPLALYDAKDPRLLASVEFLMTRCFVNGGFFQDMVHSGINAYLTLHIAQVLLRAGDARWQPMIGAVADMASPTGQWPEAIHPRTGGGCMGDGQHVWAAAEWVLMIRNCFVREEGERLVIGSGIANEWLRPETGLHFGPTLTPHGAVSLEIGPWSEGKRLHVCLTTQWYAQAPVMTFEVPGFVPQTIDADLRNYWLTPQERA